MIPFEDVVKSRGSGTQGLAQRDWLESGAYPVIGQGEGDVEGWTDRDDLLLRPAPAVVLYGGHTRRAKHVSEPFVPGPNVKILEPSRELDSRFLYYFLAWLPVPSKGYADHFPLVRKCSVPVPPLPEQRRIVAILAEAFDGLATAKASAEANLANAKAVFESELAAVFTRHDDTYVARRLDDVCREITVGHVGSMAKQYRETGVPFLRSQNIRPFEVSLDNIVYIDDAFHRSLKKSQLIPGDVAVVRTGYPGTAAVIPDSLPVSNCSDLVIVRPGPQADPHYLALFFNSRLGKELVAGRLVGTAQKHFNVTAAKQVTISCPPVPEQRRVVTKLKVFGDETERLEAVYTQKLEALDDVKKSLLHHAFSGQL